ncbi:MAG: PIG-L family deacetylase [Clostridia bacterium]|nr:PIG-L family deacetylase [Clostridia bacterium]MBN2883555.1 PIG-L family deacetylase [Clostridia bacterium]
MRVLAIGCHPDDLEIGCGGTLAKYAKLGNDVFMCHVANGNMGHKVIMPDELAEKRTAEAESAGKVLGAREVINIDIPDLTVSSDNIETVKKVIAVIRYVKPDVIITHSPEDYMRDHLETGKIVFDASFSSSVPHFGNQDDFHDRIVPLYYMDTLAGVGFLPEEYVDVTGTIEKKLEAVNRHETQVKWMKDHDGIDFLDFVKTVSKFRGLQCGVDYAEGFRLCRTWPRQTVNRLLP